MTKYLNAIHRCLCKEIHELIFDEMPGTLSKYKYRCPLLDKENVITGFFPVTEVNDIKETYIHVEEVK
jgi:hypothetical protein